MLRVLLLALSLPLATLRAALPCSDIAAYAELRNQVDVLNHLFETECPLGEPIRCYASAYHPDRRKVAIDRHLQHLNAQVIHREERPERIQADIDKLYREINRVRARDCRKRAAKARLWGRSP